MTNYEELKSIYRDMFINGISKADVARRIARDNLGLAKEQYLTLLIDTCEHTKKGAATYYNNHIKQNKLNKATKHDQSSEGIKASDKTQEAKQKIQKDLESIDLSKEEFLVNNTQLTNFLAGCWHDFEGFSFTNSSKRINRQSQTKSSTYCSLLEAFDDYQWNKKNFSEVTKLLLELKTELHNGMIKNDEKGLFLTVSEVLYWGGVLKDNIAGPFLIKARKGKLVNYLHSLVNVLDSSTCSVKMISNLPSELLSDSGATKVYSLIGSESIIYDDRVSATLGVLINQFLGDKKLTPSLRLIMGKKDKRGINNRDPSNDTQKYPKKGSEEHHKKAHFISNVKANWLLSATASKLLREDDCFQYIVQNLCEYLNTNDEKWIAIRVLEASLFMAGHNVPTK
jgi:hypothetical protein